MAQDAVAVFAEGTFEEQIHELIEYLARSKPEQARENFINSFQDATEPSTDQSSLTADPKKCRHVCSLISNATADLGSGSDREIEGYFNLLVSHIISLFTSFPEELKTHIHHLLAVISEQPSQEHLTVTYRLLANIFNAIPRQSPLRLHVYSILLKLASSNDHLDILLLPEAPINRWLQEWDVSTEEKALFVKKIAAAFHQEGHCEQSYLFLLQYLGYLSPQSDNYESAVLDTVVYALKTPTIFTFDRLSKMSMTAAIKKHPLHKLLEIFMTGNVSDFMVWSKDHRSVLDDNGLEHSSLLVKIRCLTMASIGSASIGQEITYASIAAALQIEEQEVDAAVIQVIHSGLLSGRLSETRRTFYVNKSTTRDFGADQWESLEKKLLLWKSGLGGISEVLTSARNQSAALYASQLAPAELVGSHS